jgi:hypothetical protein
MNNSRSYRTPDPEKKVGLRGKEATGRNPGLNVSKEEADMRVKSSPNNERLTSSEPASGNRRPITNQDEERNIVNGDKDGLMGEDEREGD